MEDKTDNMIDEGHIYDQDMMRSQHNHEFMNDAAFKAAYARGMQAAGGLDYHWHWRVHVGLWAANCANKLPGDFVECGVGKGFLSSAIMTDLKWDTTGRIFYLLDTFSGIDERYVTEIELAEGIREKDKHMHAAGIYANGSSGVIDNFSEWKNVRIIPGPVPETLGRIIAKRIAYLHLDMNCAPPEVAAIDALWNRMVPGCMIILDDYAYFGYKQQKIAMDRFAAAKHVNVVSLPTGQGLIIKPPSKIRRRIDRLLRR